MLDKEATIKFYQEALGMKVVREMGPEDGSWTNTFMANDETPFEIELTWNRGQVEPYNNGGKDTHIAFAVDDFDAFHELHEKMGCIIRENPCMGLYSSPTPTASGLKSSPRNKSPKRFLGPAVRATRSLTNQVASTMLPVRKP